MTEKSTQQFARKVDWRIQQINKLIDELVDQAEGEHTPEAARAYTDMRLRAVTRQLIEIAGEPAPRLVHADDLKNIPEAGDDHA